MTNGTIARFAALAGALFLAGCLGLAGGGGGDKLSTEDIERVRTDPRIVGLTGIFERADTLLIPGVHLEVSSTIRGRSRSEEFAFRGQCSGTECDVRDRGTRLPITLDDLMIDDLVRRTEVSLTKAELGKRDGFDTLVVEGRDQISERIRDDVITAAGSATSYGAWGKHGFAAVELVAGSLEQSLISGRMNSVLAYVIGRRNATNPGGVGGARWQGPVEAASTRTFLRYEGKATLTIPDLDKPRIGAAIEVAGNDISEPGWKDMPLAQGRFRSGTAGQGDYLEGNLHGPKHEEAYGVFDTGAYVGAFAARRR